jgi:hypothetical protein
MSRRLAHPLLILVPLVLTVCSGCGAGKSHQNTGGESAAGAPIWFASLQMVSPQTGWGLRWTQTPAVQDSATLAPMRTTDGGREWVSVTPPAARSLLTPTKSGAVLFALDGERAWLAVSRDRDGGRPLTAVIATANGGATWARSAVFAALGEARWLDFTDAQHGWLMTDLGSAMGSEAIAVYRTSDAGIHWSLASRTPPLGSGTDSGGLPLECDKTGITFATDTVGWVTLACNGPESQVYVSHDGARRWAPQPLPLAQHSLRPLCGGGCQASPPTFFAATGFLNLSAVSGDILFVTHDDGETWTARRLPIKPGAFAQVQFVDARHGFVAPIRPRQGISQLLYTTVDAGRTWTPVHSSLSLSRLGESLDFVSPSVGFAWTLGADSTTGAPPVYATRDGGRGWTRIVPRLSDAPRHVKPTDLAQVSWTTLVSLVRDCKAKRVDQTHSRLITVTLRGGGKALAYEPRIDAIMPVVNRANERCGPITFATE